MKKILALVSVVTIFLSCSTDEFRTKVEESSNNKELLKEVSFLIGETLQDKEVRNEIFQKIEEIDSYGKGVSLALLLGEEMKISNYEKRKLEEFLNKKS